MKISIIVAAYNVEDYIEKCLESITTQTYKNLEIIVVNDGSTDNTLGVVESISRKDERVTIIDKINGGLSSARNAGLGEATGDFIGFIDGDDYIAEDMYETLLEEMVKNNCDIAMCAISRVFKNHTESDCMIEQSKVLNREEAIKALIEEEYVKHYAWNKLYKSSLFLNIRYPEGKLYEDIFTTYKLFSQANKLTYSNKIGYYYMQRQGSILRSKFNIRKLDSIQAFHEFKAYVDIQYPSLSDQILWRANLSVINSLLDMLKSEAVFDNCQFHVEGSKLIKAVRKNIYFYTVGSNIPLTFRLLAILSLSNYSFMRLLFKTPMVKNIVMNKSVKLL
ncbi:hypothetical protein J6TS1_32650 [Siminovitchia terrae]|nr:glycosyltransferase [Siminovitchia terrae]GIN92571.1 hypothetical protein J22TS1_36220 [Siminovitchia terrae]GIN97395.1 hypothetical protein J6TS1_32650 [Siminovitchia terrae]